MEPVHFEASAHLWGIRCDQHTNATVRAMNHQKRPLHDPHERIFTLFDVKQLYKSQKKKILKSFFWGALLVFGFILIKSAPKYQISATFKESRQSSEGTGSLEKLLLA